MADGSIKIDTSLDDKTLQRQLANLKTKIAKLDAEIKVKVKYEDEAEGKRGEWAKRAKDIAKQIEEQKRIMTALENKEGVNRDMLSSTSDYYVTPELKAMKAQYQEAEATIKRLEKSLADAKSEQERWTTEAKKYGDEVSKATQELDKAKALAGEFQAQMEETPESVNEVGTAFDALEKKITQTLKRVFLFTVLTKLLNSVKTLFVDALAANEQFAASFAQLRGAVATLATVFASSLAPVLSYILNLVSAVITIFARLFALLFGKSISGAAASAKALQKTAGGYKKVAKAADEASKSLANFDEINQLGNKETETPDVGGGGGVGGLGAIDVAGIKEQISELELYVAGAMLALGAILAFTGANVPLGIALMAAGAATLMAAAMGDYGALQGEIEARLTQILTIVGGFLLVVGLLFVLFGGPAGLWKGLGLMLAGAFILGVGAAHATSAVEDEVRAKLGVIMTIAGIFILAIGVILIVAGNWPLGIGAILLGITALVAAAAINWSLTESKVSRLMAILFSIVSVAFIALGAIFIACGQIPLGVACLFIGVSGLVAASRVDWDAILRNIKKVWSDIKEWFNSNVKPYLTVEYWENKLKSVGEGIKNAFRDPLGTVLGWIEKISQALNSLGGSLSLPGIGASYHVPHLATGAVIPANSPFLAMLGDQKSGTNIEAPLGTIVDAFRTVLNERGTGNQEAVMMVDRTVFAKLVYDLNNEENRRIGVDLVKA